MTLKMRFISLLAVLLTSQLVKTELLPRDSSPNHHKYGSIPLLGRDLPTGTCNSDTPCVNGACCGTDGLCGYSPTQCGSGNCTSDCDAKAPCGEYGVAGQQNCPLNVCCSQFGFCGQGSDFCGTGCQAGFGGCGDVSRPSCSGGSSINTRTIGYYESWSNTRTCQAVSPGDLNLNGFTQINFAFAFFDPSTFQISPMDSNAASLYSSFTDLKSSWNGLQTWISVGGWSFTDPGATRTAFSDMSSSSGNRQTFINGLIKFMDTYGFDGVDLDWEYPGADDRGGVAADTANYVELVKDMNSAFGSKYGLSVTLPTSYWYLQHFDLSEMQQYVDFFGLMSYDLHGTWDAQSIYVGPYIAPHTNITEIDAGLDLLWRAGVTPDKVVLGLGWYGRSFTLTDPSCNTPNGICKFSGGADAGPCSDASGILDYQEIQDIIASNSLTPVHDETAGVKWITWNSNQWVSYDDDDTFKQKRDFANGRCLAGTMVWAMDQRDQAEDNGLGIASGVTPDQQADANQGSADQEAQTVCYTTSCGDSCKSGSSSVSQMNGQPGSLSTSERCASGQYENLCCDDSTTMGTCTWRGFRGVGLSCIGGCAEGETEVARNTNHHDSSGDYTCNGGQQSYCCSGFKAASAKSQLAQEAEDAAKEAAEAAAEQAALDLAAKAFCRLAVPALLAPLEALEALIPIFGEIADIAEVAATPALIKLCTDEVEKEGKAEFKVFGKKESLSMDKPTTAKEDRPSTSSHESASTKTESACSSMAKRVNLPLPPRSETRSFTVSAYTTVTRTCSGNLYPQPCLHYSSVIRNNPGYRLLTCTDKAMAAARPAVALYNAQHDTGWINGWMQAPGLNCQRDEFPPAVIWQGRNSNQWIRLLEGSQNGGAGQLFNNLCPDTPPRSVGAAQFLSAAAPGCRTTSYYKQTTTLTRHVLSLAFANMPNLADDGITANECWPSTLTDDPGFALLTNDPWYIAHPNAGKIHYATPPEDIDIGDAVNQPGWNKRDFTFEEFDPEDIVVRDGNSTRRLTDEELLEEYGFFRCPNGDCAEKLEALGIESAVVRGAPRTAVVNVAAAATPEGLGASQTITSSPGVRLGTPDFPRVTANPHADDLKRNLL